MISKYECSLKHPSTETYVSGGGHEFLLFQFCCAAYNWCLFPNTCMCKTTVCLQKSYFTVDFCSVLSRHQQPEKLHKRHEQLDYPTSVEILTVLPNTMSQISGNLVKSSGQDLSCTKIKRPIPPPPLNPPPNQIFINTMAYLFTSERPLTAVVGFFLDHTWLLSS